MKEEQEKGLSKEYLKRLLRSDQKTYYGTPYLNDHLFLHYKGLDKIQALEEFTGLKVLYMEGNGVQEMEGLEQLTQLRCLYLHENLIK